MQLNKLLTQREAQHRIIATSLEKLGNGDLHHSSREKLVQILTEKLETVRTLNEKIANHGDVEDLVTEMVESEQYVIDLELKLDLIVREEITTNRNENQNSREERRKSPERTNLSQVSLQATYHKLPKLTLPNFNGNITEWQTFWDCFESSVHLNTTLSDVQKFSYLRSLLQNEAASCIAGFQLTHTNYGKAIELLIERFGQPRPDNTLIELQSFYDKIETFIRGLESLGQCQETYGDLLVPIIREKLSNDLKRSMARDHGNRQWKLNDLRDAILKEINVLREGESTKPVKCHFPTASFFTGSRYSPTTSKRSTIQKSKTFKRNCQFCGEEHKPTDCRNFPSVEERLNLVKENGLCFNCLGTSHKVGKCKSHFRCQQCQRKHHTAICYQKTVKSINPGAKPFRPERESSSTSRSHQKVLLKTAIAKVSSSKLTAEAKILFDEGAQSSFISQKLADDLQLIPTGTETLHLASFGQKSEEVQQVKTATVHLETDDNERIAIDVLIVPTIAIPLSNIPKEVRKLDYLRDLKLAHPETDNKSFHISLLIGADSYWKIVQNRVIRGRGPTAVQSRIGYLLSGPLSVHNEKRSEYRHMMTIISNVQNTMRMEPFEHIELGLTKRRGLADTSQSNVKLNTYDSLNNCECVESYCHRSDEKRKPCPIPDPPPLPKVQYSETVYMYLSDNLSGRENKGVDQAYIGKNQQSIWIGDVVQIHEKTPRSRWKLAVIEELIQGNDGRVRAARIRTDSGVTNRPIVKLYPLETID